jgi:CopG family transcriptional regulator / antitoxin EndoAI
MWKDANMSKRVNIVLAEGTLRTMDRMVKPGERSRFINQAVEYFIAHQSAEALRTQLERAAIRDRDLDREVAADWFAVDSEAWQQLNIGEPGHNASGRNGARSTSRRSTRR